MSGAPAPRPVTDFGARVAGFAAQVKAVQQQLTEALSLAGFRRDPYRHIIEADVAHLGLYPEMLELMEATRQPFADKDLRRLQDAASSGAAAGAQRQVAALVRATNRRTITLAAAVFVASLGCAYWLGRVHEAAQFIETPAALGRALTGPDAAQWANLIRLNDINQARRDCSAQHGGVGCTFSFWTKPPVAGQ